MPKGIFSDSITLVQNTFLYVIEMTDVKMFKTPAGIKAKGEWFYSKALSLLR